MSAATEKLPAPTLTPKSEPVRLLLASAGLAPRVVTGCLERLAMGAKHYGMELHTHNGRPALTDALQEALDAVVYLVQARSEGSGTREEWRLVEETLMAATFLCRRRSR